MTRQKSIPRDHDSPGSIYLNIDVLHHHPPDSSLHMS